MVTHDSALPGLKEDPGLERSSKWLAAWQAEGMARAYSVDLRERLLQARDAGLAPVEIERLLGISRRTQRRWARQQADRGTLAPGRSTGRPPKIAQAAYPALRAQVVAAPDATLAEHCARWA